MYWANLGRILDRNSIIVSAGIGFELAQECRKAMGAELTAERIDGQGAEEQIGHSTAGSKPRFRSSAFRATVAAHGQQEPIGEWHWEPIV